LFGYFLILLEEEERYMGYKFGNTSEKRLIGVDERLVRVCRRALELTPLDFGIACGLRSIEEQKAALASGNSTTMKSRHLPNENGESEAVDIMVFISGVYERNDKGVYRKVCQAFVTAAIELGVQIELGALWDSFVDTPHIQLKRG
jgi:peptidoglycan L-alanyl-D-glutamate endopeptidase CwlK